MAELIINGIEHGNLNITYDEKTDLIERNMSRHEIDYRCKLPENKNKNVEITFRRNEDGLYVKIEDQGDGFDWRRFLNIDPARANNHGRGIAQTRALSFDALQYNRQCRNRHCRRRGGTRMVKLFSFFVMTLGVLCVSAQAQAVQCSMGTVPQFHAQRQFSIWTPILKELEKRTECEFIWKRSSSIGDFNKNLQEEDFDFAYVNPRMIPVVHDKHGYIPLVHSGEKKLQGIVVVSKDSPIKTLADLQNSEIAFPSEHAFAASQVVQSELTGQHSLNFNPTYLGSHSRAYILVVRGNYQAAGGVLSTLNEQNDFIRKNLRILYRTEKFPPHAIIAHPRMGEDVIQSVKTALLDMAIEKPELLAEIPMAGTVETNINDYESLKSIPLRTLKEKTFE